MNIDGAHIQTQHNLTRDYEVMAMSQALLSCVGRGLSWKTHIASTILMTIHLNFASMVTILNSSRPPSYSCDLYLGLKCSCRAPAHQGQADDMSYCHSPFCLVTPHDDVILKPGKTVHYSGANKYMPILTVSIYIGTCATCKFELQLHTKHPSLHKNLSSS